VVMKERRAWLLAEPVEVVSSKPRKPTSRKTPEQEAPSK